VESDDLIVAVIPGRVETRTSDVQLHIGESRDSGFDASRRPGMTLLHLDENRARLYSGAHDQRRDHYYRSPPPYRCGTGGYLRLRFQPLPPDPVRGISL
jgi:hypothetical protein